jgi:uncharacterized protein YjbI with pentapeptide repeats
VNPRYRVRLPSNRTLLLGALWGFSLALACILARTILDVHLHRFITLTVERLWRTRWAWPLTTTAAFITAISPGARRRWPQRPRRVQLGLLLGVALTLFAGLVVARPRQALVAVALAGILGLLAVLIIVVPRRLAPTVPDGVLLDLSHPRERLEVADSRVKLRNEVRTSALQAVAGLAVLAGALLGFQQLTEDRQQATATRELSLQGQASERFTRAIEQLGSERREVQLGGIFGLEQIAQQAPTNRLAVTEVLVAYLRRRLPRPASASSNSDTVGELRLRAPDAQAILTVLGRRQVEGNDPPLDLRTLDLRGADLSRADLSGANLRNTDLRRANLDDSSLRGTDLSAADLSRATFQHADLREASLEGTILTLVNFHRAILRDATLREARLDRATLSQTDFRGAHLNSANLERADLDDANLGRADLTVADLHGANLSRAALRAADLRGAKCDEAKFQFADMGGADLDGANFSETDLRGVSLRKAWADEYTTWPAEFDWKRAGVRIRTSPR